MPTKKAKRADGRYQTSLTIGRNEQGKPIKKFFYGVTQREAFAKKKAYLDDHATETHDSVLTLAAWIETWKKTSSPSEHIRSTNAFYADKLSLALGSRPISDIRMMDIRAFAQNMSRYSFSTVKKTRGIVDRIFADAINNRLISYNPCNGVTWDYASKGTHRALEGWEQKLIFEYHHVHRVGIWACIMLFAGLRRGEALALQWEDIDFEHGVIRVNKAIRFVGNKAELSDPKTEAGNREVPLLPQLRDILQPLKKPTGRICETAGSESMTQAAFKRGWESWNNAMENILNGQKPIIKGRRSDKDKADRKHFSVRTHDLRHTFCTFLYKAGIGLKEAQYIMGHADMKMTLEVYTHLDNEQKRSVTQKLNTLNLDFDSQDVKQDVNFQ